jgi:hypothetical protein
MYTFAESLTVVFIALAVGSLLFLVAVILVSAKELAVRLGNTSRGVALMRPLAHHRWRPAWSRARPSEFETLGPDANQNLDARIKRKWYSLLLRERDGPTDGQQSTVRAGTEPESALHPSDCDSGTAAVADGRPADTSLLEEYRKLQAMVQSVVAEYDAPIQRPQEEVSAERDKFAEWKHTKAQEEQKIA